MATHGELECSIASSAVAYCDLLLLRSQHGHTLQIHYRHYPADNLLPWSSPDALSNHFFSSLKVRLFPLSPIISAGRLCLPFLKITCGSLNLVCID